MDNHISRLKHLNFEIKSILTCPNYYFWVAPAINFFKTGPYHIETSPLICRANQWISFCMIGSSIMKEITDEVLSREK